MSEDNEQYYKYVDGVSKPWKSLLPSWKSLINSTYPTYFNSTYTVIGVSERLISNNVNFIYECSVCSKDVELWKFGSIQQPKSKIISKPNKVCCGCNKNIKWTEEQYEVLIRRRCEEVGYKFKGWYGDYKQIDNTYLSLYNPVSGNEWSTCTINNFIKKGRLDPFVSGKKSDKEHIKDFHSTDKFNKDNVYWRSNRETPKGDKSYFKFTCGVCSDDEYVKNGTCTGIFESFIGDLKCGTLSCRCNTIYRYTSSQREYKINSILTHEGGEFKGWGETFRGNLTFFNWVCSEGHSCRTQVAPFMAGVRCGTCCAGGFNTKLSATFYIVEWYGYGESYLKYGITNKTVLQRIKVQARKAHLDYKILHTFYNDSGQAVLDVENKVKDLYGRDGVCPKQWLPDGFTETVHNTPENLATLLSLTDNLQ